MAPHKVKAPMVCIGEDKHGARVELRLDLKQNKEHWNLPYSSYFFNCALRGTFLPVQVPSSTLTIKSQIAVVETGTFVNGSMAWVKVVKWPTMFSSVDNKNMTALCVKPLHNSFNRAVWLVEFIEMYQILGVSFFVFYNHSVRKDLGGLRCTI